VLEEVWTHEKGPRRLFLQAVIHIAVGLYHCQCANPTGASGQLDKALSKLDSYRPSYEGIDTARLYVDVVAARASIDAGSPLVQYPRIHPS
jgi:hypothetical protein